MRQLVVASFVAVSLLLPIGRAHAAESLIEGLKKACNKELTTFCKGVQPGEGRILACLYAFQDRVSGKCEYAIYDADAQLEQAAMALKSRPRSARRTSSSTAATWRSVRDG